MLHPATYYTDFTRAFFTFKMYDFTVQALGVIWFVFIRKRRSVSVYYTNLCTNKYCANININVY